MPESEWKLIDAYTVVSYLCGFRAGQTVALRREIVVTSAKGPTGEVHQRATRRKVLHGSKDDPGIVWFLQDDGHRCTWDDDPTIHEWFEVVDLPDEVRPEPSGRSNSSPTAGSNP